MTDKTESPAVTQDVAVELEEAKLDQVAGGSRGQPVGGIVDGTSNISDGTSNTATQGIVHTEPWAR